MILLMGWLVFPSHYGAARAPGLGTSIPMKDDTSL